MQFEEVAKAFNEIEKRSGRLEMTDLLARIFEKASPEEAERIAYIIQGELRPPYEGIDLGMGEKFVLEAIRKASGYGKSKVEQEFESEGDLGLVAEKLLGKKRQQSLFQTSLSVLSVYNSMFRISKAGGSGSQGMKINRLVEMYNNATPIEAKYITRFVLGQLRLGVGDPTILDALSVSHEGDKSWREPIERAYNLCSDIGHVARVFLEDPEKIRDFKIEVFKPIMPAMAERLANPKEIIAKLGKCAVEYKYDGFRIAVHKKGNRVEIYSRRLEKMTHMFPDVVAAVQNLRPREAIFEGEALAFNEEDKRFYSFQETMHRRRKYGLETAAKKYPLYVFAFDLHYLDGEDCTTCPYLERRKKLESFLSSKGTIKPSTMRIVETAKEIDSLFQAALSMKLEGIMAKDLKAPYTAGKRKFAWIKLKKSYGQEMDTIDAVIVGYYRGKGSRARFGFGGILVAVYNDETSRFETIAKVGSGFTEDEMGRFQKMLEEDKVKRPPTNLDYEMDPDFWVHPRHVVEVAYDNITRSPTHTCGREKGKGLALRFPRMIRIRDDKGPFNATTTKEVEEMHKFS
ncbi:ATP-dependent DNA ligase [Candidatus Micrarchaeota archaeon]|nr:ATP-dependent DNA ligase [Candidatus Micrarchaeota archaeon]MBD3417938.1 ATP-dependent DNA ligase [Candidatus Micrarchaeota archaeon]